MSATAQESTMNTSEFLGFVTIEDGYNGKLTEAATLALPNGAIIHAMPYGVWTAICSEKNQHDS